MRILDLSSGARAVWFDKSYRDAVYVDLRPDKKPDIVADAKMLPFADYACFGLVVFDPPHVNFGAKANMSRDYGYHTTEQIRKLIAGASAEAWRVSAPDALMAFKWNDHDQALEKILGMMLPWWEPLFGHKVSIRWKHHSTTQWVMLRRVVL